MRRKPFELRLRRYYFVFPCLCPTMPLFRRQNGVLLVVRGHVLQNNTPHDLLIFTSRNSGNDRGIAMLLRKPWRRGATQQRQTVFAPLGISPLPWDLGAHGWWPVGSFRASRSILKKGRSLASSGRGEMMDDVEGRNTATGGACGTGLPSSDSQAGHVFLAGRTLPRPCSNPVDCSLSL